MAIATVKIPKKFGDICSLIRDGHSDGIEKLHTYSGLEHQKMAVLAEVAYFDGEFDKALSIDIELCPFWQEWHYSNIREEHTAAMAFVARALGKQDEIISLFEEQIALLDSNSEMPTHIKNAYKKNYENRIEYMKSGIVPNFSERETYKPLESPLPLEEIRESVMKENKKLNIDSDDGIFMMFKQVCTKGSLDDRLALYEKIADNNLSTMWHINALAGYNHLGDTEKAFEVVLRMAKQRLWFAAAATQVRPMEFFTHPAIYQFLGDASRLRKIVVAFQD